MSARQKYSGFSSLRSLAFARLGFLVGMMLPGLSSAGPILMPAGSDVWMLFTTQAAPDADLDHAAGSNQLSGIPLTTVVQNCPPPFTCATFGTGFADMTATSVRTFIAGNGATFMNASMNDTYTVQGIGSRSFPITFRVHYEGEFSSFAELNFRRLIGGNASVEIGTFSDRTDFILEQFRIQPFDASTQAFVEAPTYVSNTGVPFSAPFELVAEYTRMVSVGDVFDLGIGFNSAFVVGSIDARNTGSVFIDGLPDGIFVTSALGGLFGDPGNQNPLPEPASLTLLLTGAAALTGARSRRRSRRLRESSVLRLSH